MATRHLMVLSLAFLCPILGGAQVPASEEDRSFPVVEIEISPQTPQGEVVFHVVGNRGGSRNGIEYAVRDGDSDDLFRVDSETGAVTLDRALHADLSMQVHDLVIEVRPAPKPPQDSASAAFARHASKLGVQARPKREPVRALHLRIRIPAVIPSAPLTPPDVPLPESVGAPVSVAQASESDPVGAMPWDEGSDPLVLDSAVGLIEPDLDTATTETIAPDGPAITTDSPAPESLDTTVALPKIPAGAFEAQSTVNGQDPPGDADRAETEPPPISGSDVASTSGSPPTQAGSGATGTGMLAMILAIVAVPMLIVGLLFVRRRSRRMSAGSAEELEAALMQLLPEPERSKETADPQPSDEKRDADSPFSSNESLEQLHAELSSMDWYVEAQNSSGQSQTDGAAATAVAEKTAVELSTAQGKTEQKEQVAQTTVELRMIANEAARKAINEFEGKKSRSRRILLGFGVLVAGAGIANLGLQMATPGLQYSFTGAGLSIACAGGLIALQAHRENSEEE